MIELLLAFVTAGLSDTMAVSLPIVLVTLFAILADRRRRVACALVGSVLGLVVLVVSPGNAIRQSYFPWPDLRESAFRAVVTSGWWAADAIRTAPLAVLAVAMVPMLMSSPPDDSQAERRAARRSILIIILALWAMSVIVGFVAFYATAGPLIGRARSVPVALIMAGLFALSHLVSGLVPWRSHRLATLLLALTALTASVQALQITTRLATRAETELVPRSAYLEGCAEDIRYIFP